MRRPNFKKNDPQRERKNRRCFYIELPALNYTEVLFLQHELVKAKYKKIIGPDVLLLLEHPPVFTLGRRGGLENLIVSKKKIEKEGISIVNAERGGNITYHGPGQIVGYPIISLKNSKLKVVEYVNDLEEVMIQTVSDWGVKADRNPLNRGIWVGNKKLGSIGIAIRRGISFHGFALNVNTPLKPFTWINPCGLEGVGITTMARELSVDVSLGSVRRRLSYYFKKVFSLSMEIKTFDELKAMLN